MNPKEKVAKAVSALQTVAESIRRIEAEALEALFYRDEPEAYRQKLEEKTTLLMELPKRVEPFLDGMDKDARGEILSRVSAFARGASQAWELSSIFYMSALLYPEDHREGEKNDLENFIDRLRSKYLS
jgi:hypothetical protein